MKSTLNNNTTFKGLNIKIALSEQNKWIENLRSLRGTELVELDEDKIADSKTSAIGKWLYGKGKAVKHTKEYADLAAANAEFQQCVSTVIRYQKEKLFLSAIALIKEDLPKLSDDVRYKLQALTNSEK
ncbi:CZB domain-containing protein [Stenoxybacter acetivorans]|uniref:CZB domain-containing protein n=1 Tax=Stenoxybacter acetivorans TaxID=422441 RepID=UPI0005687212|nr:CZB domain-containing protein [Stenoxybacter acetivorans]